MSLKTRKHASPASNNPTKTEDRPKKRNRPNPENSSATSPSASNAGAFKKFQDSSLRLLGTPSKQDIEDYTNLTSYIKSFEKIELSVDQIVFLDQLRAKQTEMLSKHDLTCVDDSTPVIHHDLAQMPSGLAVLSEFLKDICQIWRTRLVTSASRPMNRFITAADVNELIELHLRLPSSCVDYHKKCDGIQKQIDELKRTLQLEPIPQLKMNVFSLVEAFKDCEAHKNLPVESASENQQTIFKSRYLEVFALLLGLVVRNNLKTTIPTGSAYASLLKASPSSRPDLDLVFRELSALLREDKMGNDNFDKGNFIKLLQIMRMKLSHAIAVLYASKPIPARNELLYVIGVMVCRDTTTVLKLGCDTTGDANEYYLEILGHTAETGNAISLALSALVQCLRDRTLLEGTKSLRKSSLSSTPPRGAAAVIITELGKRVLVKNLAFKELRFATYENQTILAKAVKASEYGALDHFKFYKHPNVITHLDTFKHNVLSGLWAIFKVHQHVKLSTLKENDDQLLTFGIDATAALSHIHTQKWIHRDVKAENFVFEADGSQIRFIIIDFGDAVREGSKQTGKVGTKSYMAPEIMELHSFAMDIWSLGMTIATCILGVDYYDEFDSEKAHEEESLRVAEKCLRDLNSLKNITPIKQVMIQIVRQCLKPDPNERPTSSNLHEILTSFKKTLEG